MQWSSLSSAHLCKLARKRAFVTHSLDFVLAGGLLFVPMRLASSWTTESVLHALARVVLMVKSPQCNMGMVIGLALLVYALVERKLRHALAEHGETTPDQKGRPTATPSRGRILQIFAFKGLPVDQLLVQNKRRVILTQVLNLLPVYQQILRLLGPHVANCYRSTA